MKPEDPANLPDFTKLPFANTENIDTSNENVDNDVQSTFLDDTAEEPYVPPILTPEGGMFPTGPSLEGGTGHDAPYYSTNYKDIPEELREDVDWQPSAEKKEPRRYGLIASIFIVLSLVLVIPMVLWLPQVFQTRSAEQAISTAMDATTVNWADYSDGIRSRLVSSIYDKDCQELQKTFNDVVERNYQLKEKTGTTSGELLVFIDKQLNSFNCYADTPGAPSGAPAPAPTK